MSNKKHYSKTIQAPPTLKDETYFIQKIDQAYEKKQFEKIIKIAYDACLAFPDSWEFLYQYAEALYNHEQTWRTPHIDVLERIEQICDAIIEEGQSDNSSAGQLSKRDGRPYSVRAFASLRKGEGLYENKPAAARDALLEAERYFMDALELMPDDLAVLTGYAQTLQSLGPENNISDEAFLLAKEYFQKAMALDTEHGQAYVVCAGSYALILMRNNETPAALDILNQALGYRPEHKSLLRIKDVAVGLLKQGNETKTASLTSLPTRRHEGFFAQKNFGQQIKTRLTPHQVLRVGDQAKL